MDYCLAVGSMFLLFFAISALGLGLFTTYFGAGKSRVIGVLLTIIGIMVMALFYLMAIDYWNYGWAMCDVKDSFIGVIAILAGAVASMVLVMALMMLIKEKEIGISDIEQIQKEIEAQESSQNKPADSGTDSHEPVENDAVDPVADESEPDAPSIGELPDDPEEEPPAESSDERSTQDSMSDYIKEKEENKIVKEDWEKVEGSESPMDPDVDGSGDEVIGDAGDIGEGGSEGSGEKIGETGEVDEIGGSVGEEIEEEGDITESDVEDIGDDTNEVPPEIRDDIAEEEGEVPREVE